MTVNKERVQLLVNALRSGEFEQGKGSLKLPNEGKTYYCCLGVATEVALRNGLRIEVPEAEVDEEGNDLNVEERAYPWGQSDQILCTPVMEWYGFSYPDPELRATYRATAWNDDFDASFDTIADMFEDTFITDETPAT